MPPTQFQARRRLELVLDNHRTPKGPLDHIDVDIWARSHPPLRGLNFRDRNTARSVLRAGAIGAVPRPSSHLPDLASPSLSLSGRPVANLSANGNAAPSPGAALTPASMPRVVSTDSKITVSSVPSFGKIREPLSGDSVRVEQKHPRAATEFEEFGSEALITHVHDELDDEFDESCSTSRLFSEIGPSISVANGIDRRHKASSTTTSVPSQGNSLPANTSISTHHSTPMGGSTLVDNSIQTGGLTMDTAQTIAIGVDDLIEPVSEDHHKRRPLLRHRVLESGSAEGHPAHVEKPEEGDTDERHAKWEEIDQPTEPLLTSLDYNDRIFANRPSPPPPPPQLMVQSHGSTPAVPSPPSSPPPVHAPPASIRTATRASPIPLLRSTRSSPALATTDAKPLEEEIGIVEEKDVRRDPDECSAVTESETTEHKRSLHDELSDLAENSVPSLQVRSYSELRLKSDGAEQTVAQGEEKARRETRGEEDEEDEDDFGAEKVESVEADEDGEDSGKEGEDMSSGYGLAMGVMNGRPSGRGSHDVMREDEAIL